MEDASGVHVTVSNTLVPGMQYSTSHSASAESCGPSTLGHWHNHPLDVGKTATDMLYYSLTDQHTFVTSESAPFAFVGTANGHWCYWTRTQVKKGWAENRTPLLLVEGQCQNS